MSFLLTGTRLSYNLDKKTLEQMQTELEKRHAKVEEKKFGEKICDVWMDAVEVYDRTFTAFF